MKQLFITLLLLFAAQYGFAQSDTLYTIQDKIPCVIREITPETVKYSLYGEEVVNTVYRNTVQKIVFQNGRVQTFAETAAYRKLRSIHDFENVAVTKVESEVKGLYKIDEVTTSAQAGSMLTGMDKVHDRALRKMKVVAAMMGANVVYLTYVQAKGSDWGLGSGGPFHRTYASAAESFLSGIVYTNELPNFEDFNSKITDKTVFRVVEKAQFAKTSDDIRVYPSKRKFTLKEVTQENGHITVVGALEGASKHKQFRVASFDKDFFYIYYQEKGVAYSVKVVI
ncbi:MAG: hypothetical protein LPK07_05850 [Hymenobacteraceae bacterium]|nr:hypothetical protein [Hymenobacteraceae bacterium]